MSISFRIFQFILGLKILNFPFSVGTQNGIEVEQQGKLKKAGNSSVLVVQGSYSYTGADGRRYRVRYTADEFGYHPITELEIELPDPITGEKIYKPLEPFKFPKFGEFKISTTKKPEYKPTTTPTTKRPDKYTYGVKGGTGGNGIVNAGNPFRNSNFPSNRYLPARTYLPAIPTSEYLPPSLTNQI